jgi:hypothetical protein
MSDSQLIAWMDNFYTVTQAAPAQYGVTAEQVGAVKTKADDLRDKMAARQTAEDAAKAAVSAQKASRDSAVPDVSYLNTIIKANPNISDADKEAAGIDLRKPASKTPPVRPENLVANGFEDGRNVLKWERAGNKPNTQFIIECKADGETGFSYLATVTETKYENRGATPGKRCTYRVKAQRNGEESTYSNEAIVY